MRVFSVFIVCVFQISCTFVEPSQRTMLGEKYAREVLEESLKSDELHNVIGLELVLVDTSQAVDFAEIILFKIYGKENILEQKPYEIYKIDDYWVILGTLPKTNLGGTFLIIFDARDCRIIRLSHGK